MQEQPKVGIIIPAYNEEMNIVRAVEDVEEACRALTHSVIVVDDGSADATFSLASKTHATVLRNETNMGKGAALRTGLTAARDKYDVMVIQDADLTIPAKEIPTFVDKIWKGESDAIYASRMKGIMDAGAMPMYRKLGNQLFAAMVNVLTGQHLSDTLSGLKAFNARVLDRIEIETNSWPDFEIIFKVWGMRCRTTEVPVHYLSRKGRSKMKIFRHGSWFIWQIMKWYWKALFLRVRSEPE